jgi:hypothetical protein
MNESTIFGALCYYCFNPEFCENFGSALLLCAGHKEVQFVGCEFST